MAISIIIDETRPQAAPKPPARRNVITFIAEIDGEQRNLTRGNNLLRQPPSGGRSFALNPSTPVLLLQALPDPLGWAFAPNLSPGEDDPVSNTVSLSLTRSLGLGFSFKVIEDTINTPDDPSTIL
jgi:hypothetical protein